MSAEPWRKRRRRLESAWSEEDQADAESERYRSSVSILRLIAEVERLRLLVPDTAVANAARKIAAQEKAAQARRMRADGITVKEIAKALDRTERQVMRYGKD